MRDSNVNWQTYRATLLNFILKRVGDATRAEDLVQDVIEKAYRQKHTLRNSEKLRSWLFQIARNVIIDYYRTRNEAEQIPKDLQRKDEKTRNDPEQELTACLDPFVEQLPDHYQAAIELSELEGLTQREVAALLNLSLSGAKSRIQRGRELLEGMFLQCCKIELDSRGQLMDYEAPKSCNNC